MEKKGFVSTRRGKAVIFGILVLLVCFTALIIYHEVNLQLSKNSSRKAKVAEQKEIDGNIQWTNMSLLGFDKKEQNRYKTSIKNYLESNLYGDITIIEVHEGSIRRENNTITFLADVTTYGGFVSSYSCVYSEGKWSFSFYKDSFQYNKEALKEGEKEYDTAD